MGPPLLTPVALFICPVALGTHAGEIVLPLFFDVLDNLLVERALVVLYWFLHNQVTCQLWRKTAPRCHHVWQTCMIIPFYYRCLLAHPAGMGFTAAKAPGKPDCASGWPYRR